MHNHNVKLYKDWRWGENLEYINNIIYHSGNIILVSGVADSGKSTLKQEIINSLVNHTRFFTMVADPRVNTTTFVRQVSIGLGLPGDNNLPLDWDDVCNAIIENPDYNWVLLIDDAEKLPWEVLTSLIDLYITVSSNHNKFSLLLFADPSFINNLKNSGLKDFFAVKFQIFHLDSLSFEQMSVFLYNYMQLAFDRKTLKKIYVASNGIIGKVKQLAISELNIQSNEEHNLFNKVISNVFSPLGGRLLVCGLLLLGAYAVFYLNHKYHDKTIMLAQQLREHQVNDKVGMTNSTSEHSAKVVAMLPDKNIAAISPNKNFDNYSNNIIAGDNSGNELSVSTANTNVTPDWQQDPKYQQLYQQLLNDLKVNIQDQLSQLSEKINQLSALQQQFKNLNTLSSGSNSLSLGSGSIKQAVQANNGKHDFNSEKILKKSKKLYALQLIASKNEQTAKELIKKHPELANKFNYFVGKFNAQEDLWYIVIYNSYQNPEAALKDIRNLPLSLQKLKPLVRDYASVHKLILNNKKS